jgi:hypothetical protein
LQELVASASWVATRLGCKRGIRRARAKIEKYVFRNKFTSFQESKHNNNREMDVEAGNFCSTIQWGRFAGMHKTAFLLMEHHQQSSLFLF